MFAVIRECSEKFFILDCCLRNITSMCLYVITSSEKLTHRLRFENYDLHNDISSFIPAPHYVCKRKNREIKPVDCLQVQVQPLIVLGERMLYSLSHRLFSTQSSQDSFAFIRAPYGRSLLARELCSWKSLEMNVKHINTRVEHISTHNMIFPFTKVFALLLDKERQIASNCISVCI